MSTLEITGALTGLIGINLTQREHPGCFPVGLVSVVATYFLLVKEGLYANALLQLFFALLLLYGWWNWIRKRPEGNISITISSTSQLTLLIISGALAGAILGYYFSFQSGSKVPYLDGLTTGLSIVAQWMVARKKLENWLLWMVVNIMYVGLYLLTGLYLYALLYGVYLLMAVKGWYDWKKRLSTNETQ